VSYQLFNGTAMVGSPMAGTGTSLSFGLQTTSGSYTVVATNVTTGCTNTMSGSVNVMTNLLPAAYNVIGGGAYCAGSAGAHIGLGGSTVGISYQAYVLSAPSGTPYMPANGDVVGVTLTSSAACAMPATISNTMDITVNASQMPAITVSANPGTEVCNGTTVTYNSAIMYGGSAPMYSWIVNGVNSGAAPSMTYIPANGDVVSCTLTSNYVCALASVVPSNNIHMVTDLPVMPVVSISTNPGMNIAPGELLTLTAAVSNGVMSSTFQWFVNGAAITGATAPSYSSNNFQNGDSISCEVTGGGACPGLTGSASLKVHVSGTGVAQVTTTGSDIILVPNPNKGVFTVKGTLGASIDQEVSLEITDLLGQVIYTNKVIARDGELNERIQLSNNIANGMYMLNMHSDTNNKVFHIVIEQ